LKKRSGSAAVLGAEKGVHRDIKVENHCSTFISIMFWVSVVQLLLITYGVFYKNVTTCGPLLIKWCIKQQIHNI